ncbi:acyl-CoA N-acyltransferase [Xylariomycetidae sp. FL0641]|nr:acyl-CoA N-acyltransferase [Xylariomycetidae sp. FL0641]
MVTAAQGGPRVREARHSELPAIAHVLALAFHDDIIFGGMIHPLQDQYPNDADLYWLRRIRVNFWNYRYRLMVAVESDEKGHDTILGIGEWERLGPGGKQLECHWLDPRNLLKPLASVAMKVHALIWPNRACDPAKEDVGERAYPYINHVWSGERADSWYLEALGVRPDAQGRGIGQMLVRWGLDRAAEDGVCASVISAYGKDGFYHKCGFEIQEGKASMGEGNPLADVPGGNIWWRAAPRSSNTRYGTI